MKYLVWYGMVCCIGVTQLYYHAKFRTPHLKIDCVMACEIFGIWYDLVFYGMVWHGIVWYDVLVLPSSTTMQNFGHLT